MSATPHFDRTGAASTWVRRIVDETGGTEDQATSHPPSLETTVAAIMTRAPICVRPTVGVGTLARLLLDEGMSGVPVVDGNGRPIGVVSKTDVLRYLHEKSDGAEAVIDQDAALAAFGDGFHLTATHDATVDDIMTPLVFALRHDVEIVRAAALMAGEGIHRLAILDDTGAVVGILSALDIVRWVAEEHGYS